MLRLIGAVGLLVLLCSGLAFGTGLAFFRTLTLLLTILLFSLYGWLGRSLPRRSGTVRSKELSEPVEIYRDEKGVPHIYARNLHDLYVAQGYVTAEDRLWSMDLHRRTAAGRLAEVLGSKALNQDRYFRNVGLHRAAAAAWANCSPEVQAALEAYAAGVNARISEGRLPPEFGLLAYRPSPWSPVDSLLLCKFMLQGMGEDVASGLFRTRLVQTVGAEKAVELFRLPADLNWLHELESTPIPDLDGTPQGPQACPGNMTCGNGWAVAGNQTRSGAALLAIDMNPPGLSPGTWYQTHLTEPHSMEVSGASLPGVPGIMFGHNRQIAWSMTNDLTSVHHLYVHKVDPNQPDCYAYEGGWEQGTVVHETIRVRGRRQSVCHEVLLTRQGPVIAHGEETALALRSTALEACVELEALLQINAAGNWNEFRTALGVFRGSALHFLFAARDGMVARKLAGALPLRAAGDGQSPAPGWSAQYEWSGLMDFEDLPELIDPADGFIIAAAPPLVAQRIQERLRGAQDLTAERMARLQADQTNLHARTLLEPMLHAVQEGLRQGSFPESLSDLEKKALLLLSGWDWTQASTASALALWHQWYLFLIEGIFRPQMGLGLFDRFTACSGAMQAADRLILQVSEGGESSWLSREGEEGLNRIALRALRRAVALVAAKQGDDPERWRPEKEHRARFFLPLALGSSATAASFRLVVDLAPIGEVRELHELIQKRPKLQMHPPPK